MYERYYSTCQGMCRKGGGRSKSGVEAGRRERERYKRRRKTERPRRDTEGDGNEGGRTVRARGGGGTDLTLNHPLVSPSPPSSSTYERGRVMLIRRSGGRVQLSVCWGGHAQAGGVSCPRRRPLAASV